MPRVLVGQNEFQSGSKGRAVLDIATNNPYDYDYPRGLDLRPGSELHTKIRDFVVQKAGVSQDTIKARFDMWKKIDHSLTAYVPPDRFEGDEETEVNRPVNKDLENVVIPTSYATLEVLLSYLTSLFLSTEPYFRFEPVGPEDLIGTILLELAVAQQMRRSKAGLALHTMWRDSLIYSFGAIHIGYRHEYGFRTRFVNKRIFSRLKEMLVKSEEMEMSRERVEVFSGNVLIPLDPYLCLPDPNTPISNVQDAEFWGWVQRDSLMSLLSIERDNDDYFNFRYVKHIDGRSQYNVYDESGRSDRYTYSEDTSASKVCDVINMYAKIIPKDFGLGDSEYPEIWLFAVAGDNVVVRAQPLGLDHNKIPIAVAAPDFDGHSIMPVSRLETVYGMQTTIDWLFRSHMSNVRKAINDMIVVDPQLVNIFDLTDRKEGKIIRLRPNAFGRGVRDAVMQLNVNDVTRGHIQDAQNLINIIRDVTGAQDVISGIMRKTSARITAAEVDATSRAAISRLEKIAKIVSLQAHQDIAYQLGWNTRQLLDKEIFVRMVGDVEDYLIEKGADAESGTVPVGPESINIDFDVKVGDVVSPGSESAELWIRLFEIVSGNPELAANLDSVRIFKHIARITGAPNINDFVKSGGAEGVNVMPTEQVEREVEKGNLVPTEMSV